MTEGEGAGVGGGSAGLGPRAGLPPDNCQSQGLILALTVILSTDALDIGWLRTGVAGASEGLGPRAGSRTTEMRNASVLRSSGSCREGVCERER